MKSFKTHIIENNTGAHKHLNHFLNHVKSELSIDSLPKINLIDNKEYSTTHKSFGGYSPGLKEINVNIAGRHTADVYRTLAHELVHYRQDLQGKLSPEKIAEAGATGSEFENEANTLAGVIMRNYGKANPKIYEDYENPFRFDWGTPEGTNYMVKMTPGQNVDPRSDYFKQKKLIKRK